MSTKSKGINAERELIHLFWAKGFAALRVAGSGSSRYPSTDLIVGNKDKKLAIECKTTREQKKYISREDIGQLKTFSTLFGALALVAVKFKGFDWFFLFLDDLGEKEKSYYIDIDIAKNKGLLFEELVEKI